MVAVPESPAQEIIVYTRPGCPFSEMLHMELRGAELAYRDIDIWKDPAGAAAVRAAANGNETVPTVNVGDVWLVNPTLDEVRDALRAAA
ncbi:MAG TPA: glutaredoxin domain-containing protein [Pseudonocardiaceae bacterium]|jgi:mycoredoxin|nr:glutaredoxin domain-containing protein [Pseudonocardiaceae bacterium]